MSRLVILLSRIQHLNSFESGSSPDFLRRQSSHQPSVSDWGLPECAGGSPGELEPRPPLQHPLRPMHVRTPPSWFTSQSSQGLCNIVEEKWTQILQQIKKKTGQRQKTSHQKKLRTWSSSHFPAPVESETPQLDSEFSLLIPLAFESVRVNPVPSFTKDTAQSQYQLVSSCTRGLKLREE